MGFNILLAVVKMEHLQVTCLYHRLVSYTAVLFGEGHKEAGLQVA